MDPYIKRIDFAEQALNLVQGNWTMNFDFRCFSFFRIFDPHSVRGK